MSSCRSIVDIALRSWEFALTHKFRIFFIVTSKGEEVVKVGNFTEVRADRVKEEELEIDVAFNEVDSGFMLVTVKEIHILHG